MALILAKNSKAGCLFRPKFLKQVVIEIQKIEHPRQKFSKYPQDSEQHRFLKTITYLTRLTKESQSDCVKTVNFRVFLVLTAFRYDFYHKLTTFALNFS